MAGVLPILAAVPTTPQAATLKHACRDFEEVFLHYLVRQMKPNGEGTPFGHSAGSFVCDSLAEGAMAGALADAGGVGIADLLYHQLYSAAA